MSEELRQQVSEKRDWLAKPGGRLSKQECMYLLDAIELLQAEAKVAWKKINEHEARAVVLQKTVDRQYAELAASREKLECGHPKSAKEFSIILTPSGEIAVPFCSFCKELAATRAECYERAIQAVDKSMKAQWKLNIVTRNYELPSDYACPVAAIRALITPSAAAREEWIKRIRLEAAEFVYRYAHWFANKKPAPELDAYMAQLRAPVSAARAVDDPSADVGLIGNSAVCPTCKGKRILMTIPRRTSGPLCPDCRGTGKRESK